MVAFPSSAYALRRVVAGFGPELAPILSLEMAAGDVKARQRKYATCKPVQVYRRNFRVRALFFGDLSLSYSQTLFGGTLSGLLGEDIDCVISCSFICSLVLFLGC